jgi:hypothetical protein
MLSGKPEMPKTLYKYRSWDDKNHRRMLWHNEIYFASPRDFNDPFDSHILLLLERMTHSQQVGYVAHLLILQNPGLSQPEARSEAEKQVDQGLLTRQDIVKELRKKQQEQRDEWGIFTASSDRANILMWSHYADRHRGFCVGLDYRPLLTFFDHFRSRPGLPDLYVRIAPVQYAREYPMLVPNELGDEEYHKRQFTAKSCHWTYEEEWRLVMFDVCGPLQRAVELPAELITEVILGCRMSEENTQDEEEIKAVLRMREPKPKLFRATKKKLEFGLEIEPIKDY